MEKKSRKIRKRIFDIIQIGNVSDLPSMLFDIFITLVILVSLAVTVMQTYDELKPYSAVFDVIELVTVIIFTVEYIMRVITADFLYPRKSALRASLKFIISVTGIVDLLTFFPYYLPFVFPAGAVAFRIFRVIRIFRLFKINQRYDAFSVILDVLNEKKKQLLSSVVMITILMIAASLCMYSLEHDAQPDVFKNAFSGIWWSTSTLLTIGYGDIYPITLGGRIMAIVISFLGVGMVAVPTGIISAGFVESYSKINRIVFMEEERPIRFLTSTVNKNHKWVGKRVKELVFPPETILAAIIRDEEEIVPKGDTEIRENDVLILGAKKFYEDDKIKLTDLLVKERHEWVGMPLKKVPISRQSLIVLIRRNNRNFIPDGDTVINAGDELIIYSKEN
ncbi:MAG: ion transporter [Lachnospiraceae bacterium]|nr:ion transporter [Lachnospiraceae bacterium]